MNNLFINGSILGFSERMIGSSIISLGDSTLPSNSININNFQNLNNNFYDNYLRSFITSSLLLKDLDNKEQLHFILKLNSQLIQNHANLNKCFTIASRPDQRLLYTTDAQDYLFLPNFNTANKNLFYQSGNFNSEDLKNEGFISYLYSNKNNFWINNLNITYLNIYSLNGKFLGTPFLPYSYTGYIYWPMHICEEIYFPDSVKTLSSYMNINTQSVWNYNSELGEGKYELKYYEKNLKINDFKNPYWNYSPRGYGGAFSSYFPFLTKLVTGKNFDRIEENFLGSTTAWGNRNVLLDFRKSKNLRYIRNYAFYSYNPNYFQNFKILFPENMQLGEIGDWAFYNLTLNLPFFSAIRIGNNAFKNIRTQIFNCPIDVCYWGNEAVSAYYGWGSNTGIKEIRFLNTGRTSLSNGNRIWYGQNFLKNLSFEKKAFKNEILFGNPYWTDINGKRYLDNGYNLSFQEREKNNRTCSNALFYYCNNLKNVYFNGINCIGGRDIFSGCYNLSTVELNNVNYLIGSNLFYSCYNLKNVKLGNSLKLLGSNVFSYCPNLQEIILPKTHQMDTENEDLLFSSLLSEDFVATFYNDDFARNCQTAIQISPFYGCYNLQKITFLNNNYEYFSPFFFSWMGSFEENLWVNLNFKQFSNLKFFGIGAFSYTQYIDWHNVQWNGCFPKLERLGSGAFMNCYTIYNLENYPKNFNFIEPFAFAGCYYLSSLKINHFINALGEGAFRGCAFNLKDLNIFTYVKKLPHSIFANLGQSGAIEVNNINFSSVEEISPFAFSYLNSNNFDLYFPNLIFVNSNAFCGLRANNINANIFGNNIKIIKNYIFRNCNQIISTIRFPSSLEQLGEGTYYGCKNLQLVDFKNNFPFSNLPKNTFYNCSNLKNLISIENIEEIGDYCFYNCTNLYRTQNLNVDKCLKVGNYSFYSAIFNNLFLNNCKEIGEAAFSSATNVVSRIYLGNISKIPHHCFSYQKNLAVCDLGKAIFPLEEVGNWAFYNMGLNLGWHIENGNNYYGTFLNLDNKNFSAKKYNGYYIFLNCKFSSKLSIDFSPTEELYNGSIGSCFINAFNIVGDLNLLKVNSVPNSCFLNATSLYLSNPNFLSNIQFFGNNCFAGCNFAFYYDGDINTNNYIPSIKFHNDAVFEHFCFSGTRMSGNIDWAQYNWSILNPSGYAPFANTQLFSLLNYYTRRNNRYTFYNNKNITFLNYSCYNCTVLRKFSIDKNCDHVYLNNYSFYNCSNLEDQCIQAFENKIRSIGDYSFYKVKKLTSINLSANYSQSWIGDGAFGYCFNLNSINFNAASNLQNLSPYCFESCTSLNNIYLEHIKNIEYEAFYLSGITKINAPNVETLGNRAFEYCKNLKEAKFPSATSVGGDDLFFNSDALETVFFNNATKVAEDAFWKCHSLTSVYIPNVTLILNSAFLECSSLQTINIPNCTDIRMHAFSKCSKLESVYAPSLKQIGNYVFNNCYSLKTLTVNADCVIAPGAYPNNINVTIIRV